MYLKKLAENKLITIEYYTDGTLKQIKGRFYNLNLLEQILSIKDEKQKSLTIRLSNIRHIY
jgi:hypothetical protein